MDYRRKEIQSEISASKVMVKRKALSPDGAFPFKGCPDLGYP